MMTSLLNLLDSRLHFFFFFIFLFLYRCSFSIPPTPPRYIHTAHVFFLFG